MLKLFKNNFKTTNDCIILAAPLVIFITLLWLYGNYAIKSIDSAQKLIFSIITAIIMFAGFLSAWLYMVKKTIALSKKTFIFDKERVKSLWYLTSTLPKGVGRLFIPILITTVFVTTILFCTYNSIYNYIELNFGNFPFDFNIFYALFVGDNEYLLELTEKLSINKISAIYLFYIISNFFAALYIFFTLLWIPEIVYNQRNTFKALVSSAQKMISEMPETILLFFYILMLTLLMKHICMLILINPILYFVVSIIFYYYIVYIIVLLFSYYEQKFIEQ